MADEQTCSGCGLSKPAEDFGWRRRKTTKRNTRCRACENERLRKWREGNPQKYLKHRQRTRAERKNATPRPSLRKSRAVYAEILRGDPCAYCGGPMKQIDHITAKNRGGYDAWHNLTAACAECNNAKQDQSLLLYLFERGGGKYPPPRRDDFLEQREREDTPLLALLIN